MLGYEHIQYYKNIIPKAKRRHEFQIQLLSFENQNMQKLVFENISGHYSYFNVYVATFYYIPFCEFFIQFLTMKLGIDFSFFLSVLTSVKIVIVLIEEII